MVKNSRFNFPPMSPCLKLFIESLLAENGSEISIEQFLLDDEAIMGKGLVSEAPLVSNKTYKQGARHEDRIDLAQAC